jgi:DNA phosphorothioation-dependent restriction protein DptG
MEVLKIQKTKDNKKNVFVLKSNKSNTKYLIHKQYHNKELLFRSCKEIEDNENTIYKFFTYIEKIFDKHKNNNNELSSDSEEEENERGWFETTINTSKNEAIPNEEDVECVIITNP